jgi:hypothetical protein
MKKQKLDRSHPVLYIITMVVAAILLVIIAIPIPFLVSVMELKALLGYLIIAVAGLMMGFLTCVLVDHFVIKEKKEIIAGVIVPLPAAIALYAGFEILNKMKNMFVNLESDPTIANLFAFHAYSPILTTAVLFIFFNIPFIYYFYKKEEDSALLFYYMLAPVIIAAGAIIVNTILAVIMGI